MVNRWTIAALALVVGSRPVYATAEICGNDIDDDGNGLTDEGCYQSISTGVCESPLSCGDTGMISWSTGASHYDLPPDVAPQVPYGPGIGMRRFYTSQYTPGTGPSSVNHTPLGPGWQHTYMSWVDKYTAGGSQRVVLHTSEGRDIYFTYASTSGGWDNYTAQAGYHVMSLKQSTSSPNQYQVQLLNGDSLVYNSVGQLTEIWDNLPSPYTNKALVTWTSTTAGNVSTVTDASGKRRLNFNYTNNLLTTLQYQLLVSGTWTTEHTTTYAYANSVTQDATSGWYVPASATEWSELLEGTGFANPSDLWLMQETSGSLADSIGSSSVTIAGTVSFGVTASGWTRKGVKLVDASGGKGTMPTPNASTTSLMLVQIFSLNTNPASGYRGMNCLGATQYEEAELVNGPKMRGQSGSNTATSSGNYSGTVLVVTKLDHSRSAFVVYTDSGDVLKPTFTNQSADTSSYLLGDGVSSPDATLLYSTLFTGSACRALGRERRHADQSNQIRARCPYVGDDRQPARPNQLVHLYWIPEQHRGRLGQPHRRVRVFVDDERPGRAGQYPQGLRRPRLRLVAYRLYRRYDPVLQQSRHVLQH